MSFHHVPLALPADANVVIGQAHFIKTAEDLAEIVAAASSAVEFGLAFNEASGPCLVRVEGNDEELRGRATQMARAIGAGHIFVLLMRELFPLQVLDRIKSCPEVCCVFCATGNSVEVVVAESAMGRGVMGVIDGAPPRGVESERDVVERRKLLRQLGYKRS
jgi:hypothetical protein